MANNYWQHQTTTTLPSVAQVRTFQITADSTSNTAVWTLTLTNDDGMTETVVYTEDGSPTTTEIKDGLVAAWNASTKPHVQQITAASTGASTFTLTADTAGVPFTVALDDSDDGTDTETATTANQGINDANTANNWSLAAVPVAPNDVLFGPGAVALKYGLDQSSAALADFRVERGCSSQFGRFEFGRGFYYKIDPDLFRYEGSSTLALFDIGSAAIAPYIAAGSDASTPSTGYHNVYIKGSAMTTLSIDRGNVGVAVLDADTATAATIEIGYVSTLASDANVMIGSGTTLTALMQRGGVCVMKCAATTATVRAGATLTTYGTGAITTLFAAGTCTMYATGTIGTVQQSAGTTRLYGTATTVTNADGATLYTYGSGTSTTMNLHGTSYLYSSGALTTVNVYGGTHILEAAGTITNLNIYGGTVYLCPARTARTVTNTTFYGDCTLHDGSWITYSNAPTFSVPCTVTRVRIN